MNEIGKKLKHLRKERKLRQTDVSDFLGITSRYYQDIEYGKINIPSSLLNTLADYFKVPTDYLLGRGLFEKWELVMEHKDYILSNVASLDFSLFFNKPMLDIEKFTEHQMMILLPALIRDIKVNEGDPENITICWNFD